MFDLIAHGRGTPFGDAYLSYYRNEGELGSPRFERATRRGVGGRALVESLGQPVQAVTVAEVDGAGGPDLLVVTREPIQDYYPAGRSFWSGQPHPDAGPGKGFDVAGNWLGDRMTARLYWAPGHWDSEQGELRFADLRPIYQGDGDFQVQWATHGFNVAAGGIELQGTRYLLLFGDVDQVVALPVRRQGQDLRCGQAVPLLADGATLRAAYFDSGFTCIDLDGDGEVEIVMGGNTGRFTVLRGDRPGNFREVGTLNRRGGWGETDTLAVPCRVQWDGDGLADLIVGDASGRLWFWPGTTDPMVYGQPAMFHVQGRPVRHVAGRRGSIQGPSDAGWGYLQPTVGDWAGDGRLVIITNDIRGELTLYRPTHEGSLELAPEPMIFRGEPLPAAWRSRPAILPDSAGLTADGRPSLVYMDGEGDLALAVPAEPGGAVIERTLKLRVEAGQTLRLCGPAGHFGRGKLAVVDWDEDGPGGTSSSAPPGACTATSCPRTDAPTAPRRCC